MKKSILSIGKALNRVEQKEVSGGFGVFFDSCSSITVRFQCTRSPECAWGGSSCYTKTPHIV